MVSQITYISLKLLSIYFLKQTEDFQLQVVKYWEEFHTDYSMHYKVPLLQRILPGSPPPYSSPNDMANTNKLSEQESVNSFIFLC